MNLIQRLGQAVFDGKAYGCPALRRGQGNPSDLLMGRPRFDPVTAANRVHGGTSAQSWACRYITCRAGVFQTVETQPGSQRCFCSSVPSEEM